MTAVQISPRTSPLSAEQTQQLEALTRSLSSLQAMWVRGYLAGLHAAESSDTVIAAPAAGAAAALRLTVMYGSQTGNSEGVARRLTDIVRARGIEVMLVDMADYKPRDLKKEQALLIVVSSHGEGDPPDSAQELYDFVQGNKAPRLDGLRYSVLALGDSSYEHFCSVGRVFDERLAALGGKRVHERVDCDLDYDDPAAHWSAEVVEIFAQSPEVSDAHPTVSSLPAATPAQAGPSRKKPYVATLLNNIVLNGSGSDREVHHIELDAEGSGLEWAPGDSLGVIPRNPLPVVDDVIARLALDPAEPIPDAAGAGAGLPLHEVLATQYEITTLTRPLITKYAELAQARPLQELLQETQRDAFTQYVAGRQLTDLIGEYPVKGLAGVEFLKLLRRLPPRLYSIASSHAANPDEVHLMVAAVRYTSHGRPRQGVASVYLADRLSGDDSVPVYIESNKNFKLPDDDVPIIMIGPGTGVAPFRAFLEERETRGAKGRNWLFFGAQHFHTDFYYQIEWLRWRAKGLLTRIDVAFSRDQAEKVYVQHRLLEQARELYAWLQDGAQVYVCGDAGRMAHDVHAALTETLMVGGGLSAEAAAEYMTGLQKDKRYHRDVY